MEPGPRLGCQCLSLAGTVPVTQIHWHLPVHCDHTAKPDRRDCQWPRAAAVLGLELEVWYLKLELTVTHWSVTLRLTVTHDKAAVL